MTFVEWMYANGHNPSAWQMEVAGRLDAAGPGEVVEISGGKQFGKSWLLKRWAEYREAQQ